MEAVGSEYERLLAGFLALGGDAESCPFDAGDYKYTGPRLEGGQIVLDQPSPISGKKAFQ